MYISRPMYYFYIAKFVYSCTQHIQMHTHTYACALMHYLYIQTRTHYLCMCTRAYARALVHYLHIVLYIK